MVKEFTPEDKKALAYLIKIMIEAVNKETNNNFERGSIFDINYLDDVMLSKVDYLWDDTTDMLRTHWGRTISIPSTIKDITTYRDNKLVCLLFWADSLIRELIQIAASKHHPVRYVFESVWVNNVTICQDSHLMMIIRTVSLGLLGCVISYLDVWNANEPDKEQKFAHVRELYPAHYDAAKHLIDLYTC